MVVSVTQHYETRGDPFLNASTASGGLRGNKRSHSFSGVGSSAAATAAAGAGHLNRQMHAIGFAVYEVPPNVTRLTAHFVAEHVRKFLNKKRTKAFENLETIEKLIG